MNDALFRKRLIDYIRSNAIFEELLYDRLIDKTFEATDDQVDDACAAEVARVLNGGSST